MFQAAGLTNYLIVKGYFQNGDGKCVQVCIELGSNGFLLATDTLSLTATSVAGQAVARWRRLVSAAADA